MKLYEKTWFTVVTLLLFFPLGVFLMWKYKKFNKVGRIVLTAFFSFILVAMIFGKEENNQATSIETIEDEVETSVVSDTDEAKREADAKAEAEAEAEAKAKA